MIALIPLYLPYRNEGEVQSIQSPVRQANYSIPPGTIYATGSLTQAQLAYLVAYVKKSDSFRSHSFALFLVSVNDQQKLDDSWLNNQLARCDGYFIDEHGQLIVPSAHIP